MSIEPDETLAAALAQYAQPLGKTPEEVALAVLRAKFLPVTAREPQDEWERQLFEIAKDCGVSLSDWAVSSEGIYE